MRNHFSTTVGKGTFVEQQYTCYFETEKDGSNPRITVEKRVPEDLTLQSAPLETARSFIGGARPRVENQQLINSMPQAAAATYSGFSLGAQVGYVYTKALLEKGTISGFSESYNPAVKDHVAVDSYSTIQVGFENWTIEPMVSTSTGQFKVRATDGQGREVHCALNKEGRYVYNSPVGTNQLPIVVNNVLQGTVSGLNMAASELKNHDAMRIINEAAVEVPLKESGADEKASPAVQLPKLGGIQLHSEVANDTAFSFSSHVAGTGFADRVAESRRAGSQITF